MKMTTEQYVELEELAKEEEEFPYCDEDYWFVDSDTEVIERVWYGDDYDRGRASVGNVFKTKEQAEFTVEKLKVESELRKFSRPFEPTVDNYYIVFNTKTGYLGAGSRGYITSQGVIYFESEEKVQQAIYSVGEERIKKYIFGVEE